MKKYKPRTIVNHRRKVLSPFPNFVVLTHIKEYKDGSTNYGDKDRHTVQLGDVADGYTKYQHNEQRNRDGPENRHSFEEALVMSTPRYRRLKCFNIFSTVAKNFRKLFCTDGTNCSIFPPFFQAFRTTHVAARWIGFPDLRRIADGTFLTVE